MTTQTPITVTSVFVADLHVEGQRMPMLVWLAHTHEPWQPDESDAADRSVPA